MTIPGKLILLYFNGNKDSRNINIPEGDWNIVLQNGVIDESGLGKAAAGEFELTGRSALILHN